MKPVRIDYRRHAGKEEVRKMLAILKVVADSPEKLRLCDVERLFDVCESAGIAYVHGMARLLLSSRIDAYGRFADVAGEAGHVVPNDIQCLIP